MLFEEWYKQKKWEQEVNKWTSRFRQAQDNNQEWQKVLKAYLQTDVWKEIRKKALDKANGKCERCGNIIFDPDVHHLNYDRIGGNEIADDLKVLCSRCHRKADKTRDEKTSERLEDRRYQSRLNGFARNTYGDDWRYERDEYEVEIEFIKFLYKEYCDEFGFDFNPPIDPETDADFIEFWDKVLDGSY